MKMKLSSSSSLHDFDRSGKKLQFTQLQIQSKKDLQTLTKIINPDHIENITQLKPQFSWQLYNSHVSQQKKQDSQCAPYSYRQQYQQQQNKQTFQPMNPYQQNRYAITQQLNSQISEQEIQSQAKIQQKKIDLQFRVQQRQSQILFNKCISNGGYLKTQYKQLQKLIVFSGLLQEQIQLKQRIFQLNSILRKCRLRSLSKKISSKQKFKQINYKNNEQITNLASQIKLQKRKSCMLQTKLLLMDNYLNVNKNQRSHKSPVSNRLNQYQSEKLIDEKRSSLRKQRSSSRSRLINKFRNNPYTDQQIKQAYYPVKSRYVNQQSETNYHNLLKQHAQIIKQTIQDFNKASDKKAEMLIMQKISLRKQLENIKLSILKIQNQGRRSRSMANSLGKASFNSRAHRLRKLSQKNLSITPKNKKQKKLQSQNSVQKLLSQSKIGSSYLLKNKNSSPNFNELQHNQTSMFPQQIALQTNFQSNMKQTSTKQYASSKNGKNIEYTHLQSEDIRKQYFNN